MKDPHDPRDFRVYVSFNDSGAVAATHAFDATIANPGDQFFDVTDLPLADFTTVVIDATLLVDLTAKRDALTQQRLAVAQAQGDVLTATAKVTDAVAVALVKKDTVTPVDPVVPVTP